MADAITYTQEMLERDKRIVWSHGNLSYLLFPHQRELRDWWRSSGHRRTVFNCARRWGKSRLWLTLAWEVALTTPGGQIMYAAKSQKQVRKILVPHMRALTAAAPPGFAPKYDRDLGAYRFPTTDALLHIAGCDKEDDREGLRGTETHLGILDEAGSLPDLRYIAQDILLPQTMECNGRMVLVSTPPKTPDHPFVGYIAEAQAGGFYVERDTYTASHVTDEKRAEYMRESGGEQNATWQREYLCKIIVDPKMAVVPEFSTHEDSLVGEHPRPPHFDRYVALDFGWSDLTFAVFGYWDFAKNTVVVEDELVWERANSQTVTDGCKAKERELWDDVAPFLRVADVPRQQLADIQSTHSYQVVLTNKDDKNAQINALRVACTGNGEYRVRIHPRCVALRAHVRHAIWNRRRTEYERSGECGHFDGVDALLYLIRNISRTRNPYPPLWRGETHATHYIPPTKEQTETQQAWSAVASGLRGRR